MAGRRSNAANIMNTALRQSSQLHLRGSSKGWLPSRTKRLSSASLPLATRLGLVVFVCSRHSAMKCDAAAM